MPGITAKPIVDILVELPDFDSRDKIRSEMEAAGYICMSESEIRMSFNKGYTHGGYGDKVFHIHFHRAGDKDAVIFRDYLLSHPASAEEYERLKLSLLPRFRNDRDGYTEAKTEFVRGILVKAKNNETE